MRSLVTPYWSFNVLEVAYISIGMALALPVTASNLDWTIWAIAVAYIWLGSAGANNLDLAGDGLSIDMNTRVQVTVGYTMLAVAVALGIVLSIMTSWIFIITTFLSCLGALMYNLEWFDGLFHDRIYPTGIGNLGFTAAFMPIISGYILISPNINLDFLGISSVAFGLTLVLIAIHYIEEDLKKHKYESFGIIHDRDIEPDFDRLQRRAAKQQIMNIFGISMVGLGCILLYYF